MKYKSFFLIAIFVLLIMTNVSAQTASVWAVDFVKTKNGKQADYLQFVERNWAKARAYMKEKGVAKSYQVLSMPSSNNSDWDVLLMTEYANQASYEKREDIFNEWRKNQPADPTRINPRDISEIKFSRAFGQPISSEIGKAMLAAQTGDAEIAAARVPLENYLQGHATGNAEFMRKAFHTEGKLIFIRDGKYTTRTFDEYIAGMKDGKPAPDEDKRKRWIESMEVSGNSAVGKIILDYPNGKFVDYMTLLKIDGEWKIVNKSFYFEPKAQAATQK